MGGEILAAASTSEIGFITDLLVMLASATAVAIVMRRMRLAVVPAYLIAGAVIGPHALGLVPSPESLGAVSHLAVILLLFGIGLELNLSSLRHSLGRKILAGLGSCWLSVLLGWPIAMAFGLSCSAALAVCMGLALSSTAVVLRIMAVRRDLRRPTGRLALAVLVIQDLLVLAMLAFLPALAGSSAEGGILTTNRDWMGLASEASLRVGAVAALILLSRLLLPRLLHEAMRARSTEVMMIVGVTGAIATAVAAKAIGFSLEMGAFLAGFLLAGTQFRHQLAGQIGPLRDLFIALFFIAMGMMLDPMIVAQWWWAILLGVAAMMLVKATTIAGTCWVVGISASVAIDVGFSLAQAGEFSLILLGAAQHQGILTEEVMAAAVSIVIISLVLTPGLFALGRRLSHAAARIGPAPWIKSASPPHSAAAQPPSAEAQKHVVIGGYGPIGRLIVDKLEDGGIRCTVIELNPLTVQAESTSGRRLLLGDVSNPEILESAGIAHADGLVLTVPDEEAVLRSCAAARRMAPDLFIAVRMGVVSQRTAAMAKGANHVTVDEMAAAQAMLRAVMGRIAITEGHRQP